MPRPDLSLIPEFYHKYVGLVDADEALAAMRRDAAASHSFFEAIPDDTWAYRYAEGKWSIKEVMQHIIDTERIFTFRSLCIARGESASLPGFDENAYAAQSKAARREKSGLLHEFSLVRQSTIALFESFDDEQLAKTGTANNKPMTVNGIGFILVGHVRHHLNIVRERYLSA